MDAVEAVLTFLKLSGVVLAAAGVFLALTKGRKALSFAGGGVVGKVTRYIMAASIIYLCFFIVDALSVHLGEVVDALSTIILFGLGVCFFAILWEIMDHLEEFKKYVG